MFSGTNHSAKFSRNQSLAANKAQQMDVLKVSKKMSSMALLHGANTNKTLFTNQSQVLCKSSMLS